jgi:hypothetical protein
MRRRPHQITARRTYMGSSWRRLEMQAKRKPQVERPLTDRVVSKGSLSCYFMFWTNVAILCMLSLVLTPFGKIPTSVHRDPNSATAPHLRFRWASGSYQAYSQPLKSSDNIHLYGISNEQAFGSRKEWGDVAVLWSRRS